MKANRRPSAHRSGRLMAILLLLLIWQGVYLTGFINSLILPSPKQVLVGMIQDTITGELPISLLFSILMILLSLIPALLAAFLMALTGHSSSRLDRIWESIAALIHPLPGIALLPLLILWTGLGTQIIMLIVIHSALWPLYMNLRAGFRDISPLWLDVGRNNGLNRRQVFFQILLPGAFPSLITGLKIAWARAWRAVIAAEMIFGTIGTGGGLGWYIFNKRIFMDTPGLYGGVILLMILGILVDDLLFKRLEKPLELRWGRIS